MPMVIDLDKCDGCGKCDAICPGDIIHMRGPRGQRRPWLRYPDECWHCGSCRQDCRQEAISVLFPPEMLCI